MKILILSMLFFVSVKSIAQTPINIVNICNGLTSEDVSDNTYFKDINQTFDNYIGTWVWTSGNEIVTFKLTKVTQKYFPEERVFEDYMIGNYSYSTDGGTTFIVNTITTPTNEERELNPMYTACVNDDDVGINIFAFDDVIIDKGNSYCTATFEFLPNSTTQMQVTIENPKGPVGRLDGQPPFNPNFTIPTNMIVTKQ
ncbi:hypothetical protein N7U66_13275 [Lacinutrix neustonica]|uniref:DUF6705 domain-containing protein n=1 Tax=Lacinutrix neustonica TaxID=2980107 RepID=A0A9E8SCX9_9FLAO|nr:DUF6705 family protein [Lacinutrix neustonica]WAC01127.1 hypothetical protein N7U66_13275 [Lacinutrix neustonica]